jgi:endo-1,4-beta-mannosidase
MGNIWKTSFFCPLCSSFASRTGMRQKRFGVMTFSKFGSIAVKQTSKQLKKIK